MTERHGPASRIVSDPTPPDASVLLVVKGEPAHRLDAVWRALVAQEGVVAIEVLVAAPPEEIEALPRWAPEGPVCEVRAIPNPRGERSAGLNRMLAQARAPVVVRVDARSRPPTDYVARCLRRLDEDPRVGAVGAIQVPTAANHSVTARGIARSLANPWLLGNAGYRRRDFGGEADTAYLGAYRRDEIVALGGWDERLPANEDFDLNTRIRAGGFKVWVEPGLAVAYESRSSLVSLGRQYRAFGAAKARYWRLSGRGPNRRQTVAVVGAAAAATAFGTVAWQRGPWVFALLAVSALAVLAVDHRAGPPERDPRVRVVACAGYAVVVGAWLWGIAVGLVASGGRRSAGGNGERRLPEHASPVSVGRP